MTFQVSDLKRKHFLDLLDSDNNIIKPSYIKGWFWLKFFSHSNSLCARALRAITNHTPISEYRLRFFFKSLDVCTGYTPSKKDIISFMSAEGLTNIGTQEGIQLATLSCSLSLTLVYLLFQVLLHYQF